MELKDISNVVQFNQNDEFYFKLGNDLLKKGDFFGATKYLLKSLSMLNQKNNVVRSSFCLLLAEAYANLNNIELSNYFYFSALEIDFFSQLVFRSIAENFIKKDDILLARFYLNKCLTIAEGTKAYESALLRIETLKNKTPKFKVLKPGEDLYTEKAVMKAGKYMSQGKFKLAAGVLENNGNFADSRVRAELCLAYFFSNENEKCIEIIEKYGEDENILDLCNLCLIYFCNNEQEKLRNVIKKISKLKNISPEDSYKIGLTMAQINELEKAKNYMGVYLSGTKAVEKEFKFIYSLVCINNKNFEEARKILIDLKTLDPFASYIYDYYISICANKKADEKVDYIFNLPVQQFIKVQEAIKVYEKLNQEDLLTNFLLNKNEFYYIASLPETKNQVNLLSKLAELENIELTNFFNFYLLSNFAKYETKVNIALKRFAISTSKSISFVRDDIFIKITVPNMQITKNNNQSLFEGVLKSIRYLLQPSTITNIDLRKITIMLERKLKENLENCNIVASVVTYLAVKNEVRVSVNKVCKYFGVSVEEFNNFVTKYNIDL